MVIVLDANFANFCVFEIFSILDGILEKKRFANFTKVLKFWLHKVHVLGLIRLLSKSQTSLFCVWFLLLSGDL